VTTGAVAALALALAMPGSASPEPTMRGFRTAFEGLLPYITSSEAFASGDNGPAIEAGLARLQAHAEPTSHAEHLRRSDMLHTLAPLRELLGEARRSYASGHAERARTLLGWSVGVCASCHSRLPQPGLSFDGSAAELREAVADPLERARLLFAFRRHAAARSGFAEIVRGYPANGIGVYRVVRALEYLAAIDVRVARDPDQAIATLTPLVRAGRLPGFVRLDVEVWLDDLRVWQAEPSLDLDSAGTLLAEARRILGASVNDDVGLLRDRSRQVPYLRASGLLHQLLAREPTAAVAAEAQLLLGICYMSLDQQAYLGLDAAYLTSCVRRDPSSVIARRCFGLLEESVILGFSGSSGTHVPDDIQAELDELRAAIGRSKR